jgi:hypothetical protein
MVMVTKSFRERPDSCGYQAEIAGTPEVRKSSRLGPRTLNFSQRIFPLKSIGPLNDSQLKSAPYSENIEKSSGKYPGHQRDLSLANRLGSENKLVTHFYR